jgi:undecaprenyl-diphosphatase
MAQRQDVPEKGPLRKIDEAVIAPRRTRRYRAAAFQTYVFVAAAVFVTLAAVAHWVAYFPFDLRITLALQAYHGDLFARAMYAISWLGFMPQVWVICLLTAGLILAFGLRWEALMCLYAEAGVIVGSLVKLIVTRPRPSADLVHVFAQLPSSGFPSGHVLEFTCFCGYLIFLNYTLVKPSLGRSIVMAALLALIVLMGPSRIYQGQHWFSDVMGAYLLGSLWLAGTIKLYRWGKRKFFVRQPVAPEVPAPGAAQEPAAAASRAS